MPPVTLGATAMNSASAMATPRKLASTPVLRNGDAAIRAATAATPSKLHDAAGVIAESVPTTASGGAGGSSSCSGAMRGTPTPRRRRRGSAGIPLNPGSSGVVGA